MTKDLEEYYKHITYISDKLAKYEDEEGNSFPITPSTLLVASQYQTLNKEEYDKAVFNQLIPKNFICKEVEVNKVVPKYEISKDPKDQFILTDVKEKAKEVWFVSNGLGIKKAYNDKEEALRIVNEINNKIFEVCKIDI